MKPLPTSVLLSILIASYAVAYDPLAVNQGVSAIAPQDLTIEDGERKREIPIRVYLPPQKESAPVVLFSHGLGGTRAGSRFHGQHWAARGYMAVFLQHPGSDDSVWKSQPLAERAAAMRKAAGLQNFNLRAKDVPAVMDQLESRNKAAGDALAGRMNLEKIGMAGHSFGAVTTQAVSGQSFAAIDAAFTDPRIRAALVLSPSRPAVGDVNKAFAGVKIPWLLMTGTKDIANIGGAPIGAANMEARLAVFPALPPENKYQLVLDGAEHSVFTDRPLPGESGQRNPNHHRVILALSTAFWDAYLKEDADAKAWLDGDGPRSVLEEADKWQKK